MGGGGRGTLQNTRKSREIMAWDYKEQLYQIMGGISVSKSSRDLHYRHLYYMYL